MAIGESRPSGPISTTMLQATVVALSDHAAETSVGMKLEGNTATLQGELKAELESKERFGGGTAPVDGIEAPYWSVDSKRLEASVVACGWKEQRQNEGRNQYLFWNQKK